MGVGAAPPLLLPAAPQHPRMPTTTHPMWKIVDQSTGLALGVFSGDTALDNMARQGGHDDYADLCVAEGRDVEAARSNLRLEVAGHTLMTS